MSIGSKIKETRQKMGITQKELAHRLGTSPQNLAQYESGKRNPKLETIKKIATALNVPIKNFYIELEDDGYVIDLSTACIETEGIDKYLNQILPEKTAPIDRYKSDAINYLFEKLNDTGQDKAIEQVELLTRIPEYLKKDE